MRGSCALLFLLGACRAAPVSTPEPSAFNAPWEGLEETDQLTGACTTDVGTADQGAGWFHAAVEDVWGVEGCWVRVVRPDGASEDLVIATLAGRDGPDGWFLLELDVAASAWVEGYVLVNGTEGTGALLRRVDGVDEPIAYAVDGYLVVDDAGTEDGDDIAFSFDDLAIGAVSR